MATTSPSAELKDQLRARFAGKTLHEVPTPSVVLDLAKVETTELTRLQVGDTLSTPVSLIVSTLTEAEHILPLLQSYQSRGRPVNVLPTLDMQQLATHARDASLMTADDIAISVVAEVASVYPERGANGTTEALINAGTLALGREPVADKGKVPGQDYPGWGFVMPWGLDNPVPGPEFPRVHDGWQVGRISQEHGILTWQGRKEDEVPLQYGQRVRVWPNHSCIAGAGFDWYLIVDSRNKGREDEVVDVWPRWRGW
ncbi:hypothetical protein NEMBOFW57_002953 [Staphylotrichum longicolle]|uniref:D-serine dehydratase-like domain-containing protein n=1 Tax=Staphylotrichum longicolle TaxID=669026 RepID=A0AAD4I587_9PEZI|nr:hypothetical protein NEMBOFW57_002953 [Staphylotrichum longicolle]